VRALRKLEAHRRIINVQLPISASSQAVSLRIQNVNISPAILCYVGTCHHGMVRPRVAVGGDGFQIWWVVVLNKQSRTTDKEWTSNLGTKRGANNSSS